MERHHKDVLVWLYNRQLRWCWRCDNLKTKFKWNQSKIKSQDSLKFKTHCTHKCTKLSCWQLNKMDSRRSKRIFCHKGSKTKNRQLRLVRIQMRVWRDTDGVKIKRQNSKWNQSKKIIARFIKTHCTHKNTNLFCWQVEKKFCRKKAKATYVITCSHIQWRYKLYQRKKS